MRIFLAPMEGVVDHLMRDTLSRLGGIDICVTEFLRVTDHLYPDKVFYRRCPELASQSLTPNGTPVRLQLLGGQAEPIAENAQKAASLGASAIDLNFGCPAKTVNKHDGGACLLQSANRLYDIVSATRKAVADEIPVTAKIRLGFNDRSGYVENAQAIYEAGANELTVHARSKVDGYRPPAYWESIAEIREAVPIPVIANGEIWSLEDFERCKALSGCSDFMLGRGLLAQPDLARQIKNKQGLEPSLNWEALSQTLLSFFYQTADNYPSKYMGNRLKQWLHYLQRQYPQAKTLFTTIKAYRDKEQISTAIKEAAAL